MCLSDAKRLGGARAAACSQCAGSLLRRSSAFVTVTLSVAAMQTVFTKGSHSKLSWSLRASVRETNEHI